MLANLTNGKLDLQRGGLFNLQGRRGTGIACAAGLVWVTLEGEPADYWLVAGDTLTLARPGRVVLEAAQASRVVVRQGEHLGWPERWSGFLRRLLPQFAH